MISAQLGGGLNPVDTKVQDLGKDLAGLFGQSTRASEVYSNIGEATAKIQVQDKILNANSEIAKLRSQLGEYIDTNNEDGILDVSRNINRIVRDVAAGGEDFKYNDNAYKAYSDAALNFGSKVLESYEPMTSNAYLKASKNNHTENNNKLIDSYAKSGVPILTQEIDSAMELNTLKQFDDKENRQFRDSAFLNNFELIKSEVSKEPAFLANNYGLTKLDKDGKKVYNLEGERAMISKVFGDLYTTDENGLVVATGSNKHADAKEIATLSSLLGTLRSSLTKKDEGVYSAEFAAKYKQVSGNVSDYQAGNINRSDLTKSTLLKDVINFDRSTLSTGQEHELETLAHTINLVEKEGKAIDNFIIMAINNGDYKGLETAGIEGISLSADGETFPVAGNRIKKEITNAGERLNINATEQFRSGDWDNFVASNNIHAYATAYYNLTGKKLDIVTKAENIVSGGDTGGSINPDEYRRALILKLALAEQGKGTSNSVYSQIEINGLKENLKELARLKEQHKDNPKAYYTAIANMRKDGVLDINTNSKYNMGQLMTYDWSKQDAWYKFGKTPNLTNKELSSVSLYFAKNGIKITSQDVFNDALSELYTTQSNKTIGGFKSIVPKIVSDSAAEIINKDMAKHGGIKDNQSGYRVMMLPTMSEANDVGIRAILLDPKGNTVYRSGYKLTDLDAINKVEVGNISTGDVKGTAVPKQSPTVSYDIASKYNINPKGAPLKFPTLKSPPPLVPAKKK